MDKRFNNMTIPDMKRAIALLFEISEKLEESLKILNNKIKRMETEKYNEKIQLKINEIKKTTENLRKNKKLESEEE
jgi:hypothetical protein